MSEDEFRMAQQEANMPGPGKIFFTVRNTPRQADLWCDVFRDGSYRVNVQKPPNRFHRLMQELLLGVKWRRDP